MHHHVNWIVLRIFSYYLEFPIYGCPGFSSHHVASRQKTHRKGNQEKPKHQHQHQHQQRRRNHTGTMDEKRKRRKQHSKQPTPQLNSSKYPWLPFPRRTDKWNELSEEVFCTCREPDTGELMVGCDGCDDWFHFKCVRLDVRYSKLIAKYYCPYCDLEGKGCTLWKRKCRLPQCYSPIRDNNTKYCSEEHGVEFMKLVLSKLQKPVDVGAMSQIVKGVASFEAFQAVGDTLPLLAEDAVSNDPRLRHVDQSVDNLNKQREEQLQRRKLLVKTKENLKRLNDELSLNKKKITVCGFDPLLRDDEQHGEDALSTNDIQLLKRLYEGDEENTTQVCLLDKRKCQRHNGWQSILHDEIENNIYKIDEQVSSLKLQRDKLISVMSRDHYEALLRG